MSSQPVPAPGSPGPSGSSGHGSAGAPGSRRWRVAFAVALVVQLVALYLPTDGGGGGLFPGADKIAHLLLFGAVGFTAVRVGWRVGIVFAALAVHAVASELIQHWLLPQRAGDPWDALADVVGAALGVFLAARTRGGRP